MKILMTGDFHSKKDEIHNKVILEYLDYLEWYYFENDIDILSVNGDVFHHSTNIKNENFTPLFLKFLQMKEKGVRFIFTPGNHDITNVNKDSIIETFSSFGDVYKEATTLEIDGKKVVFAPYTKRKDEVPTEGDFLITHLAISDFEFNDFKKTDTTNAFPVSYFENFIRVFSGHFHKYQEKYNISYIGAPFQMKRDEEGHKKGFMVLDVGNEIWEYIEYDKAPVYKKITEKDFEQLDKLNLENTYVVVEASSKIKDFSKLRYILFSKGAIDIIPVFHSEIDNQQIELSSNSNSMSIEEIVEESIKEEETELNNDKLIETFRKIKAEV